MPPSFPAWRRLLSFKLTIALVITFTPTIYFFYHVEQRRRDHQNERTVIEARTLLWTYLLTGIVGISFAMLIQSILAYLIALLCFGSHATAVQYLSECAKKPDLKDEARTRLRREMSRRREYWLFMFMFSFLGAALVEDAIKYCAITFSLPRSESYSSYGDRVEGIGHAAERAYSSVSVAVAVGMGYATFENIAFIVPAARTRDTGSPTNENFALTVFERVIFGIPGHSMLAALIGTNVLAMREAQHHGSITMMGSWWQVLRDPVLFHGSSDFALFAVSAWEGNVGWVHPKRGVPMYSVLGVVVGLQCTLALVLRGKLGRYGLC